MDWKTILMVALSCLSIGISVANLVWLNITRKK